MIGNNDQRPYADVLLHYQSIVAQEHPQALKAWPLLNGWNLISAKFGDWAITVIKDAGFTSMLKMDGIGELTSSIVGVSTITHHNRELVRRSLEKHFDVGAKDAVFLLDPDGDHRPEFEAMLARHEKAMGLSPMKIFLSHKGYDKPKVRQFRDLLRTLGFEPWLDEDAMPAGTPLERGILKGFDDSCGAVFFVTPQFKDQDYLATEVEYAIAQKRKKGDKFAIITLVFGDGTAKGTVPNLLQGYVWKEPSSDTEAMKEILLALPIVVGGIQWR